MKRLYLTAVCLILLGIPVDAGALPRLRRSPSRGSSVTLRKRLHINDLITEPGTVEIDWAKSVFLHEFELHHAVVIEVHPLGHVVVMGPHGIQHRIRFNLKCC